MTGLTERRAQFRALHQSGCFTIPNPWDGGTAVRMQKAGFKALASTSAGAAWALGKADGEMTVDEVLDHLRFLVGVTDMPVNADFEAGFSHTAEGVAANVARAVETGIAGVSIEDWSGQFFSMDEAVARLKAARAAIDASGADVMLVGRCEAFRMKTLDMAEVIARIQAYDAAGADVLYAPGLKTLDQIAEVVRATAKPVNANLTNTGLAAADLAQIGVRRVSVGGALARAVYNEADKIFAHLATEGRLPDGF